TTQFNLCSGAPGMNNGGLIHNGYLSSQNTASIGGYIKIERQDADSSWHDVTMEILNYGIGAPNLDGLACADPTPNAIVRLQRLHDNGLTAGTCPVYDLKNSYEWIPNSLFDAREGTFRDDDPGDENTGLRLNGVMYYVTVDAKNLAKWFKAASPYNTGTG